MTIMIPQDNVEAAKLRGVIRKIDVRKVIEILKDRDVTIDNQTWNRRYREYMEKINTGSIYDIAEVLRDLHLLKDGERTLLRGEENHGYGQKSPGQGTGDRPGCERVGYLEGDQFDLWIITTPKSLSFFN